MVQAENPSTATRHHLRRSISIADRKTSVSLEDEFWDALKEMAAARNTSVSELVAEISHGPRDGNLSSAIRLYVLNHYRIRAQSQ